MTDGYSITYSFRQQPAAATAAQDELYAMDDVITCPLVQGTLLVGRSTGNRLVVQPSIAMALQHCLTFLPLETHARNIVNGMPAMQLDTAEALRVLNLVRQGGLMLDARDVCARLLRSTGVPRPLAPTRVVMLTCDRPAAIARLLDSLRDRVNAGEHEAFFLIDDSRDGGNARRNQDLVAAHNARAGCHVRYVGAAEQARLLQQLLAALPECEAGIRFLLDRERWHAVPSYGLARTLALLLTVDRRAIVLDDDVLCEAFQSPQPRAGLRVSDAIREAVHLAPEQDWRQALVATAFDPLAGHAQCLGMRVADALRHFGQSAPDPVVLAGSRAGLFVDVDGDAPLLVTQCGTLGDPGTGSNAWMLRQTAAERRATVASAGSLGAAFASRSCWIGYRGATLNRQAVMSQVTGIDNTHLLPPYFPVFRGEDSFFGAMVGFLHPAAAVLNYGWAVPHLPLAPRSGNRDGDSAVAGLTLDLGMNMLTERRPLHPGVAAGNRLLELELLLRELADCPDDRLETECAGRFASTQALAVQYVNDRLSEPGDRSPDWDAYLERELRATLQAVQQPYLLADIVRSDSGLSGADVARQIRSHAEGFADALHSWRGVREVARSAFGWLAS